jgi:hypothetical protein
MNTRREFVRTAMEVLAAAGVVAAVPGRADACLAGRWKVSCPNGHVDLVTGITCQHVCETCRRQAFAGTVVTVVCPDGHANKVETGSDPERSVTSVTCSICMKECRIPEPPPTRSRPDHDHR